MASTQPARKRLPAHPSEENLKKQAKRRAKLEDIQLADAQHRLAGDYGCQNWAELVQLVEAMNRGAGMPLMSSSGQANKPLQAAARAKDMDAVHRILEAGQFSQDELDSGLAGALWYGDAATLWPKMKVIADLLLEYGADPDGFITTYGPIVFGTGECLQPESLQYLIDAGADVTFGPVDTKYGRQCPLSYWLGAYVRGDNDRKHRGIEILLKHGAYVPLEVSPPMLAIHRGDAKTLADFLDEDRTLLARRYADMPYGNIALVGATLLHCAVEFNEIECLEEMFKRYAGINIKADVIDGVGGQTPIFHVINTNWDSSFHTLEYLVKRVGTRIDLSVKANFRLYDKVHDAVTPLEFSDEPGKEWGRKNVDAERQLLRGLDRQGQLSKAIQRGDLAEVTRTLDAHPQLLTPALWPPAVYQAKSYEITKLLLDRGLNPDLCSAPRKPLHLAVYQCLADIVELLIQRGADVNQVNPLGEKPLDLLDAYEPRPLGDAEAKRIREALTRAGAREDIHVAVRAGDVAAVEQMLDADPSLIETLSPWPPLYSAARSGRIEVAKLLIKRGAKINARNAASNTPLWFACQSPARAEDRIAVAKLLIDAGARIRDDCENGSTALHFAAWRGPVAMVELLLLHGAKEWQPDTHGKRAIDYARDKGVAADRNLIIDLLAGREIAGQI